MYLVKRGDSVPPIRKPVVNGYWEIVGGSSKICIPSAPHGRALHWRNSPQEITKIVVLVMDSRFRIEREGGSDDQKRLLAESTRCDHEFIDTENYLQTP